MVSLLLNQIFENMIVKCNMLNSDNKVKRHPLSFLVEAADSISYNIMDIEDGLTMGWYSFLILLSILINTCKRRHPIRITLFLQN